MTDSLAAEQSGKAVWWIAIPCRGGGWYAVSSEAVVVEGLFHKISFPGFESRSGEDFGISATFHVFDDGFDKDEIGSYGLLRKHIVLNGRLASSEVVGVRERVIQFLE
jgi:hypothetical protein